MLKYSLFIVNVIKCYLMTYLYRTPSRRYIYGSFCETLVCNCAKLALWCVLHRYLSIICYEGVIFNFHYFIAVPIGKTRSMSLMKFDNRTFCIFFYFTADFKQVFTILQNLNDYRWNRFLTNVVNKACTGFYTLKMVSGKKTEISVEKNFRSFVFIYQ